jgi:peptidoglycan hydrolase-like protein with peptidoglycan-binding domain
MSRMPLTRQLSGDTGHDTVDVPVAKIFFQKSPAKPSGDTRGIQGITWQVTDGTNVTQSGTTSADGLVQMEVPGDTATLQILVAGSPVATYTVSIRNDAAEDDTTIEGVQRRLRALGYQIGNAGADGNGVDGQLGPKTDRAIHDFQADHSLVIDGNVGTRTRNALNGDMT